eukprot:gene13832-16309_t
MLTIKDLELDYSAPKVEGWLIDWANFRYKSTFIEEMCNDSDGWSSQTNCHKYAKFLCQEIGVQFPQDDVHAIDDYDLWDMDLNGDHNPMRRGCKQNEKNSSGYRQYTDPNTGRQEYTHRRVAEKKYGGPIPESKQVHHINKDKLDNRPSNLVVIDRDVHQQLHRSSYNEDNGCFRCGRNSHWAEDCYARSKYDGSDL